MKKSKRSARRILLLVVLLLTTYVTSFAQPKPDLTITEITWRNKPTSALITVRNVGAAAADASFGSYGCKAGPNEKSQSLGFGGQFGVPALAPGQKFKVFLDCGGKARLTGAGVDSDKKVNESNESNNEMLFAGVQKNSGPIKKPGS
jgi:hypothetical protein